MTHDRAVLRRLLFKLSNAELLEELPRRVGPLKTFLIESLLSNMDDDDVYALAHTFDEREILAIETQLDLAGTIEKSLCEWNGKGITR